MPCQRGAGGAGSAGPLLNSCQCLTIGEWLALLEAEGLAKPMRMGNAARRNIVMLAESQLAIGLLLLPRRHG